MQRGVYRDPPFSLQEQRKLERLSKSLSRAAMIAQAMARASASAALEAFDISNIAVVLVNRTGEVVAANKAAKGLLKSGIRIVDGRLNVSDPDSTAQFEGAVRRLVAPDSDAALLPPIRLPRRGRPPILAHPLRLENVVTNAVNDPLAAIILIDPGARKKSSESHLHIAFRLTPAEAKLASALATGEPLDRICEQLEISKETGRNQLKSIFAKTGTRRQAELVLVMSKML
jgi:DNA-binding CsgD family transcriptional regulator